MTYNLSILLIGSLTAICCALSGSYLLVRKMAMIGDAISHTVLLGIVLAFLISSQLGGIWMFVGATAVGVATAFAVQLLHQFRVRADAAIGITFTTMFAVAVLLISLFADRIHIDLDHVLYGEIAFAPFDKLEWFGVSLGPQAVWILSILLIIILISLRLFAKEIVLISFDRAYATSIGLPVATIHYLLMCLVSVTTVAAFDVVGSILVVAMLVVPPATAYLFARSFTQLLVFATLSALAATLVGYIGAVAFDVSIAGAMAVAGGLLFVLTFLARRLLGRISRT